MANYLWRVSITRKVGVLASGMWVEILSHNKPMFKDISEAIKQKYGIQLHGTIPSEALSIVKL